MKILGVDPGLIRTGYGLVSAKSTEKMSFVEAGVIKTDSHDNISTRLKCIYKNLSDIIKEHKPDVMVIEKLYSHYKHPVTSLLMGHARGVICLAAGVNNIGLINYGATRIKKAVTGNGRATKHQVQRTVKSYLGLRSNPEPVDITDALAMAISYVFIEGVGR